MRTGRIQDVEEGLSEFPHVIVNQARMLAYLRDAHGALAVPADARSTGCTRPTSRSTRRRRSGDGHAAARRAARTGDLDDPGEVRRRLRRLAQRASGTAIGRELVGDATDESWGVMDVLAVTDFPDIRLKCADLLRRQGNILIIPREGGYLVRLYIELDEIDDREMLDDRSVTPEKLATVANRILHPYRSR